MEGFVACWFGEGRKCGINQAFEWYYYNVSQSHNDHFTFIAHSMRCLFVFYAIQR